MESIKVDTVWFPDFKKELPKVDGKVFAITGTTSGTGYIAARTAAELGGTVLLLNRPSERAAKALDKLRQEVPSGTFQPIDCDLQSFQSVRKAAKTIQDKCSDSGIYSVCWNAGIMATPDEATVDGYDTQMQTNHLSHFLLTKELVPLLETCAAKDDSVKPRIVNHSSGARHMTSKKALESQYLEKNGGNLGGNSNQKSGFGGPEFERYFHSKLANAVFTKALHQKLQAKGSKILAVCADPGMSTTSLGNHLADDLDFASFKESIQTPEDGAMGIIKGMIHPDVESGVHYGPATSKGPAVPNEEKPYETDADSIKMLWESSEAATGVQFVI